MKTLIATAAALLLSSSIASAQRPDPIPAQRPVLGVPFVDHSAPDYQSTTTVTTTSSRYGTSVYRLRTRIWIKKEQ